MELSADHLVQRAWAAYQSDYHDLAEREARGALVLEPNHSDALSLLSLCAIERRDRPTAVRFAKEAIGHAPNWAIYHYRLALVYARFGDHKAAEPPLRETFKHDPELAPAYSLLAWVYYSAGYLKTALDATQEALKFDPTEEYALTLRIEIFKEMGSRKLAEQAAHDALAVNPENDRAHALAGALKLVGRKRDVAIDHLRESVRLNPSERSVRQTYVQALEQRSLAARMIAWFSDSLRDADPRLYFASLFFWLVYLFGRRDNGPLMNWEFLPILLAICLHTMLILCWWGPLLIYFTLRDNAERRIVAAQHSVRDRSRLVRPWQIAVSLAMVLSTLSMVLPGVRWVPIAGAVAGLAPSLRITEIPKSWPWTMVSWMFVGVVCYFAVQWIVDPTWLVPSGKENSFTGIGRLFPFVIIVSAAVAHELSKEKVPSQ